MNTQLIPNDYQHISPAGAEVRLLKLVPSIAFDRMLGQGQLGE